MNLLRRVFCLAFIGYAIANSEVKIEPVPSPRSWCGEGPHWDVRSQSLYYIDIEGTEATVMRYDYNENKTYAATVDSVPLMTFVLPVENTSDEFIVGAQHAAKVIRWDGKSPKGTYLRDAFELETNIDTNRFNDAKCDPAGRFFGGTQRYNGCDGPFTLTNASFYRYDRENGVKQLKKDVFISNGLTWVTKTNKFYYIDSCSYDVKEFDYNIDTGEISNERTIFLLREDGKKPDYVLDGMTSDVEGNLFIATYNGHKVMKVNPTTGEILAEYRFPNVSKVTSVAFGGPNLDILFATTCSRGDKPAEAGHLHKITGLGTKGSSGGVKIKL